MSRGTCACYISLPSLPCMLSGWGGEGRAGVFFFHLPGLALCTLRFVYCRGLYATLSWSHPLCKGCVCWKVCMLCHSWHPRPQSTAGYSRFLSVPQACHFIGATVHELFTGWEVQLSLFSTLEVTALPGFARFHSSPLGPAVSFSACRNPSCFRTPSFLGGTSSHPEVLHLLLFMVPSSLLPPFQGLAYTPGGLGSSAIIWLLCRSCSISWWAFDVFVGRLVIILILHHPSSPW